jgi:hypothetical protein
MMHQPVDYEDPRFYSTQSIPVPAQGRGILPTSLRLITQPRSRRKCVHTRVIACQSGQRQTSGLLRRE